MHLLRSDKECTSVEGEGRGDGVVAPAGVGGPRYAICKATKLSDIGRVFVCSLYAFIGTDLGG